MTADTKTRLQCAAVWSLTLLIPLSLLLAAAVPWWQQLQSLNQGLAEGRDRLQRYQRLVATLPALRAELERAQANDEFKAYYYDAETPALAGAQLQNAVQDLVRGAGARPISTQILPVDQKEHPPRVPIRIQIQATTDELLDLLYRIEEARPFLFVDQMSIRSTAPRAPVSRRLAARRAIQRRNPRSQVGELTVRLDIFGYSLGAGQ